MMTKSILATLMVSASVLFGAPAYAVDNFDVVRDERGIIVHNTFGNCVRTRWVSAKDACGPQPVAMVQQQQRTYIAKDERTVYFQFDKSNLTPEAVQKINALSQKLVSDSNVKQARIVGYADRIGNPDYNLALSQRRAESVRKQLVENGVVTSQKTDVRWLGETAPKTTNCPDNLGRTKLIECLAPDRRVEVEVDYLPVMPAQQQPVAPVAQPVPPAPMPQQMQPVR